MKLPTWEHVNGIVVKICVCKSKFDKIQACSLVVSDLRSETKVSGSSSGVSYVQR